MEWLKEILKKSGIDETKLDQTIGDIGKSLPEHFIPKARYNEVAEAKKKLEADIAERDQQLETLKASAGNSEELKAQIQKLQADNKAAADKWAAEAKELKLNTALKLSLAGKVHDPDIVAGLLNKEALQLDDNGNIKAGLDDQLKSLRESKGFLFVPEKDDKQTFKGFKPFDGQQSGGNDDSGSIGKQLAAMNRKSGDNAQKAQVNYFGG